MKMREYATVLVESNSVNDAAPDMENELVFVPPPIVSLLKDSPPDANVLTFAAPDTRMLAVPLLKVRLVTIEVSHGPVLAVAIVHVPEPILTVLVVLPADAKIPQVTL